MSIKGAIRSEEIRRRNKAATIVRTIGAIGALGIGTVGYVSGYFAATNNINERITSFNESHEVQSGRSWYHTCELERLTWKPSGECETEFIVGVSPNDTIVMTPRENPNLTPGDYRFRADSYGNGWDQDSLTEENKDAIRTQLRLIEGLR